MNRIEADHDDEEDEMEEDGRGWWMMLPVIALGMLVFRIADAAMTSVFDEDEE